MRRGLIGLLVAAGLLLAGCSSDAPDPSAQPATDPTPSETGPQTFGSVLDLKDAAVEAGYSCPRWRQTNKVTLAAESGTCDADSVLSTYASDQDLQQQLDTEKETAAMLTDVGVPNTPMLVGPNWILKDDDAAALRDALGGVLVGPKG